MLLVTFHGGSNGINNVVAFETPGGKVLSQGVLAEAPGVELSELRSMELVDGYLYVASGGKSTSSVQCYQNAGHGLITYLHVSTMIAATVDGKHGKFETALAHPFGIAFDGDCTCYVSNQDTNVVAQVSIDSDHVGSLGSGCQSAYLNNLFPPSATFLDGTYVASHTGALPHVGVTAPDVPKKHGGLHVTVTNGKVQNSVRDVAVSQGSLLLVCDVPHAAINMYALADGKFLGHSPVPHGSKPTHLNIYNGDVYVSAASSLFWAKLPHAADHEPSLDFHQITIPVPSSGATKGGADVGGVSFAASSEEVSIYIAFQGGKGGAFGGSIRTFAVKQPNSSSVPVLSDATLLVESGPTTFEDTPEFVLYVAS